MSQVRTRVQAEFGEAAARLVPSGYQRLGSVVLLRLPESLRPAFPTIGAAFRSALGVDTVLRRIGPVAGEFREPSVEPIAGGGGETTVQEHGIRYRFDATRVLFARGNRTERHRFGRLVREGETVVDLFAGIGYFSLPALVTGRAALVHAVEKNPVSFGYLSENLRINHVEGRARIHLGDNRDVALPKRTAHRVVLGYLPSSLPWVGSALPLLLASGGWLHVHLLVGNREGPSGAARQVEAAVGASAGGSAEVRAREVKPYGPGCSHVVVDAWVTPGPSVED
ncbi:MAG: class I SAM-dependent methyltransferase family protein [Thermoplasmata archaeon]|nr:class I SAM-dependent methyltransferase family protein [Thermoplasmata archaeon]